MIPYAHQDIRPEDIEAVSKVLQSDFLTQGPEIPAFEKAVKSYCGAKYAVATNSATSALHIACLALGLKPGGLLWTSPITFVASANCGIYCGADVDFVDIDPVTWNLDSKALKAKLEKASETGRLPDILVAVHFTGQSCDMLPIQYLSRQYGFKIIEDASHAIGGRYKDTTIGSCTFSDITVFSFHPVKIITTGEGGMALSNNAVLADRMRSYRSHGISRDTTKLKKKDEGCWYYEQSDVGFNYRMTDIQAVLGRSQLHRLDEYIDIRHKIFQRYTELLADLPLQLPRISAFNRSAIHLFPIVINSSQTSVTRRELYDYMHANEIAVNVHYIPVHTQPFYQSRFGFKIGDFPCAEAYYSGCLSLPMYATLLPHEQDKVCSVLKDALGN